MAASSKLPYLNAVRKAVTEAMCIRNLPCQLVRGCAACCVGADCCPPLHHHTHAGRARVGRRCERCAGARSASGACATQ
jgi:hypothetical protein